jgi:hypothetical protein
VLGYWNDDPACVISTANLKKLLCGAAPQRRRAAASRRKFSAEIVVIEFSHSSNRRIGAARMPEGENLENLAH